MNFQERILVLILSTIELKATVFLPSIFMGQPKYVPSEVVFLTPRASSLEL